MTENILIDSLPDSVVLDGVRIPVNPGYRVHIRMIYAAFRAQYGINLNQTPDADLHWWEFKAMFESLREDLLISRVMYYRTANLSGMSKNEKAFIKKMRSVYAIRQPEVSMDARARLAARNNHMLEYVRSRTCRKE